ncbi:MAG: STAS domain-containing protein [Planctomycetota bacterium]
MVRHGWLWYRMVEQDSLEITNEQGVAVARFRSASITDLQEISAVSERIRDFVEKNRPRRMVFDFERVKFFSSQVLGLIMDVRARLQAYSGEVVISAIDPQLHRVFRITNLDRILKFFPDSESAVKSV